MCQLSCVTIGVVMASRGSEGGMGLAHVDAEMRREQEPGERGSGDAHETPETVNPIHLGARDYRQALSLSSSGKRQAKA